MPDVANVRWLPKVHCLHDEVCESLDWALLDLNPDVREYRIEEDIVVRHGFSGCLAFSSKNTETQDIYTIHYCFYNNISLPYNTIQLKA